MLLQDLKQQINKGKDRKQGKEWKVAKVTNRPSTSVLKTIVPKWLLLIAYNNTQSEMDYKHDQRGNQPDSASLLIGEYRNDQIDHCTPAIFMAFEKWKVARVNSKI